MRAGLGARPCTSSEWPARLSVLDDLRLRIAALLHHEIPVVSVDDRFRFEELVPSTIANDALLARDRSA